MRSPSIAKKAFRNAFAPVRESLIETSGWSEPVANPARCSGDKTAADKAPLVCKATRWPEARRPASTSRELNITASRSATDAIASSGVEMRIREQRLSRTQRLRESLLSCRTSSPAVFLPINFAARCALVRRRATAISTRYPALFAAWPSAVPNRPAPMIATTGFRSRRVKGSRARLGFVPDFPAFLTIEGKAECITRLTMPQLHRLFAFGGL